jgi:DNA-binding CsgD family transcriptional regulator
MPANQHIKDYIAANPEAKPNEIALACKCSVRTVYNCRAGLRAKAKSSTQSDAKLLAERDQLLAERNRVIKTMEDTTNLLMHKIEKLMVEKHLYDERETKLMGVIDYLESKVDGLAV